MFNRVERARTRNKVLLQKPAFISQLLSVLFSFVKYWIIWPLWASNCWEDETKNTPLYKFCRRVSKEKGMLRWMLNRISCRATVWDHRLNGSVIHLINSLLGKKKNNWVIQCYLEKTYLSPSNEPSQLSSPQSAAHHQQDLRVCLCILVWVFCVHVL